MSVSIETMLRTGRPVNKSSIHENGRGNLFSKFFFRNFEKAVWVTQLPIQWLCVLFPWEQRLGREANYSAPATGHLELHARSYNHLFATVLV